MEKLVWDQHRRVSEEDDLWGHSCALIYDARARVWGKEGKDQYELDNPQ